MRGSPLRTYHFHWYIRVDLERPEKYLRDRTVPEMQRYGWPVKTPDDVRRWAERARRAGFATIPHPDCNNRKRDGYCGGHEIVDPGMSGPTPCGDTPEDTP